MPEKQSYNAAEVKAGEHLAQLIIACEDAAAAENTSAQAAGVIRAASELAGMLAAAGVPVSLISSAIFADMVMQFVQQTGGEATVDRLVRTADLVGPIPSLEQAKLIAVEVAGTA